MKVLHRGPPISPPMNAPIGRTAHCAHVILANVTKGIVLGRQTYPRLSRGSNPIPIAPKANALSTELLQFLREGIPLDTDKSIHDCVGNSLSIFLFTIFAIIYWFPV